MTKEEDHKLSLDLLHIAELRRSKAGQDTKDPELRQLRRIQSESVSQPAGPPAAEEREESYDGC